MGSGEDAIFAPLQADGAYHNGESNREACGKNEKLGLYKGYIGCTRGNRMSQH